MSELDPRLEPWLAALRKEPLARPEARARLAAALRAEDARAARRILSPPAALAPQVQNSRNQRLATWQVIGATGFGALLTALLLIVGARMRRREA